MGRAGTPCCRTNRAVMVDGAEPMDRSDPGTAKLPHMLENIGADSVHFTADEVKELNAALARTPVHGARLPAMVLSLSGVEAPAKQKQQQC
jgi:hypothetical protein